MITHTQTTWASSSSAVNAILTHVHRSQDMFSQFLQWCLFTQTQKFCYYFLVCEPKNFLGDPGHCKISPSLQTRITHHACMQNVFQCISNTTDNLCKSHAFPECKINLIYTRKTNFSPISLLKNGEISTPQKKKKHYFEAASSGTWTRRLHVGKLLGT